jgi:CheY-like chemotaxis protein
LHVFGYAVERRLDDLHFSSADLELNLLSGRRAESSKPCLGENDDGGTSVRVAVLVAAASPRPDLVLLDVRLGDLNGSDVCRQLATVAPTARIVMLIAYDDAGNLRRCLEAGAAGVLLRGTLDLDLVSALRDVRMVIDGSVARSLKPRRACWTRRARTPIPPPSQRIWPVRRHDRSQYAIPIAFLRVAGLFSAASMAWAASAREIV